MLNLIKNISCNVIETFASDVILFKTINSEIGYGTYISIHSFEAFLQDYSQVITTYNLITPNNFGFINNSEPITISVSGELTNHQYLYTPQTNINSIKNKSINNIKTSSGLCIFTNPEFNVTGMSKIITGVTSGSSNVYIIETATTLTFGIVFTSNTNSFTANNATFKYEIYKYNNLFNEFNFNRIYNINPISYSAFSGTNSITQIININSLNIDGDYVIKGYYEYNSCTDYLKRLGILYDTSLYKITGSTYGNYNLSTDYYFIAIKAADTPIFRDITQNSAVISLYQQVIIPQNNQTVFAISNNVMGDFIVTLNGLVLANNIDYIYSDYNITLTAETITEDILTIIYTTNGSNNITTDIIDVTSITSGATNGEGNNQVYYNTISGKYELFTLLTPIETSNIIVMINGVTLANNIDYYQSSSNPKRIILEGNIIVGDVITIAYFAYTSVNNGISTNTPTISWVIDNSPQTNNGLFTLEISSENTFSSLNFTATTPYVSGQTLYYTSITITGAVGTQYYYRVKNNKKYISVTGDIIHSIKYSETIPITILTNNINTY